MEIKIICTPKEMADLVKSLQSQPEVKTTIDFDGKEISETILQRSGV